MLIHICPIKALIGKQDSLQGRFRPAAAVLCSSFPFDEEKLGFLPQKLLLRFHDRSDPRASDIFTPTLAAAVRDFVDSLPPSSDLFICCDSGQSRSSAIAAATYRYLNKDEMIVWKDPRYHPNPLVYRLQCEAYGLPLSRLQLLRRRYISRRAFHRAIRQSRR